jgi:PadR family transcriptional regulator PadR
MDMASSSRETRVDLLQGTLDLLILRTLQMGPTHGHAITKHIQRTSDEGNRPMNPVFC